MSSQMDIVSWCVGFFGWIIWLNNPWVTRGTHKCICDPTLRVMVMGSPQNRPQKCCEQPKTQDLLRGEVQPPVLTQRSGELLRLVVVHHCHAERVEGDHAEHDPVEALSFHHAPDEEPKHFLFPPEVGRALVLPTLQTGTGKRRPWAVGHRNKSHHTASQQAKGQRILWGAQTHSQAPETHWAESWAHWEWAEQGHLACNDFARDEGWDYRASWISAQTCIQKELGFKFPEAILNVPV